MGTSPLSTGSSSIPLGPVPQANAARGTRAAGGGLRTSVVTFVCNPFDPKWDPEGFGTRRFPGAPLSRETRPRRVPVALESRQAPRRKAPRSAGCPCAPVYREDGLHHAEPANPFIHWLKVWSRRRSRPTEPSQPSCGSWPQPILEPRPTGSEGLSSCSPSKPTTGSGSRRSWQA